MCSDQISISHMWHNQQSIVCGHHQLPSEHNMPGRKSYFEKLFSCGGGWRRPQVSIDSETDRDCADWVGKNSPPRPRNISTTRNCRHFWVLQKKPPSGVVMYLSPSWIYNISACQVRQRRPERGIFHRQQLGRAGLKTHSNDSTSSQIIVRTPSIVSTKI